MARTVKPEAVAAKRKEILDAAQRLVLTRGYEQMSIQDVLDAVGISNGAFHHYFGSRDALLGALTARIQQESEKPLLPLIHDPGLSAIQKLQGFFDTLDSLRAARKAELLRVVRVWYNDANAVVRLKVDEAVIQLRAPLINEIVRQGIREGVFSIAQPEKAGEVVLALVQGMGNTHARLLLDIDRSVHGTAGIREQPDLAEKVREIVVVHAAYMEAVERVLGAPPGCLRRADTEAAMVWVVAIQENGSQ